MTAAVAASPKREVLGKAREARQVMLEKFCASCFRQGRHETLAPALALCGICREELRSLRLRGHQSSFVVTVMPEARPLFVYGTSLFRYSGIFRRILHRAKIKGDQRALDLLATLLLEPTEARDLAAWADVIVGSPSSFWGRLRGRLDVAQITAAALAKHAQLPLLSAPLHLHWRFVKRARLDRSDVDATPRLPSGPQWSRDLWLRQASHRAARPERILLVDDVVTTGHTLMSVAAALPRNADIRFLTLATAKVSKA